MKLSKGDMYFKDGELDVVTAVDEFENTVQLVECWKEFHDQNGVRLATYTLSAISKLYEDQQWEKVG